jgi:lysophospholipase L1-like esterase
MVGSREDAVNGRTFAMRARLWWLVGLTGMALVLAAPGALSATPRTIVSFGDSIAAGEGSGADHGYPDNPAAYSAVLAARLSGTSYNFSITGACASAGKAAAPGTDASECKVSKSIMTQQIPAARKLGPATADVVTVTVGADDIHFSDCFRALVFTLGGPPPAGEPDPCAQAQLTTHLQALSTNLGTVLSTVKTMYPTAKIAVTGYGNVIPQFVDSKPGSLCSTVKYFYAYELFKKGGAKALAVSLITRKFDKQVGSFQASLYQYSASVLQQLNATIQAVASSYQATFVPLDLTGHDFCRDYASSTSGWVFAPLAKGDIGVTWHGLPLPGRHYDFRPHTLCVPQQPAPACNVTGPLAGAGTKQLTLKVGPLSAHATMKYSFFAVLNDFPHLTPNGEAALAGFVRTSLGL